MKIIIFTVGLFISLLLESTILSLPLVLLWLLIMVIIIREEWIFFIAILVGFILDSLKLTTFGLHSLFFCLFCLLIFLYEQKFELKSIFFVFVMSSLGTVCYSLLFGGPQFFLQLIFVPCIGVLLFLILSFLPSKKIQEVSVNLIR